MLSKPSNCVLQSKTERPIVRVTLIALREALKSLDAQSKNDCPSLASSFKAETATQIIMPFRYLFGNDTTKMRGRGPPCPSLRIRACPRH
jgi:hypothetical protein